MQSGAAVPPVGYGLLVGTAAVWVVLELRQSVKRRPDAVTANWASEVVFRLAVAVGAVAAGVFARLAPAAAIPAVVAWVGLGLLGVGSPCGSGASGRWAGTSPSSSRRAVISR